MDSNFSKRKLLLSRSKSLSLIVCDSRSEIYSIYPNKFVQMDEKRIHVLNTLFAQPETYILACVISFFTTSDAYTK